MLIVCPMEGENKMGQAVTFSDEQYQDLGHALDLAEEVVSEHYRFSEAFWLEKGRYEIKTLVDLEPTEVTDRALAQIVKYEGPSRQGHRSRDFFRICIQDHRLLSARRSARLKMGTLMVYVLTHELVHVVRFARHDQLFEAPASARAEEERRVHDLTGRLLKPLGLAGAEKVVKFAAPGETGVVVDLARRAVAGRGQAYRMEETVSADLRI